MKNEKILILGDSYSTYEGYVPEGYDPYYPKSEPTVDDVSKTWWHMLATETESEIVFNSSRSGSTVCNMGYEGDNTGTVLSFIHRLEVLIKEGFFEKNQIDRVFVFGGTNDSWSENACGNLQFSDWSYDDLLLILPGFCHFADKLLSVIPKEKIHFLINCDIREEVINGIIEMCKHYNITYTRLVGVDKDDGHPTYKGMIDIKNQLIADI